MKNILIISIILIGYCYAYNNGVARTPPMGWNSWNHFGCETQLITEDLFMQMADAMVKSGMKDAGYEYINIDDCWLASTRDANGNLLPDPKRFPSGIKALADYVHSLGLKFGIYEDTGNKTCGGYPGSEGHYQQDAQTYAEWGVDYVKLDGCYTPVSDMKSIYTQNSQAFNKTGRPMVFSCSWPAYANLQNITTPYDYIVTICNLWREWYDIRDSFESWTEILDYQESANLYQWAGPGNWNDPDMLEVGNGNQTDDEYRSHFSLWAMLAAPLIAGNDLRSMTQNTIDILTAPEVIAVDQDSLGKQGRRVAIQNKSLEVWARALSDGGTAVALFNRSPNPTSIVAEWVNIGIPVGTTMKVRDLWKRADLGSYTNSFTARVLPHATVLVKLTTA